MIGRGKKANEQEPEQALRGFDDYESSLGDVLRGERATRGKSLLDVQRELKIKAAYIAAIENSDPTAFDTPGFIAGYVRSYARYLGMDPDWTFQTFCDESGFSTAHGMSPSASTVRSGKEDRIAARSQEGDIFSSPMTPFTPAREAIFSAIEPRAIGSVLVLLLLIGGIGYGGWTVLQEVQRVQLAPVEQPPTVVAEVDPLAGNAQPATPSTNGEDFAAFTRPSAEALDRLYRPQALDVPILVSRDAPIATLDPRQGGALIDAADPRIGQYSPELEDRPSVAPDGTFPLEPPRVAESAPFVPEEQPSVQVFEAPPETVTLVAVRETWLRVRSAEGVILREMTLQPGESYDVPLTELPPTLRTGNAGGLYLAVGTDLFGPIGGNGEVVDGVALSVDDVLGNYAIADLNAEPELARYAEANLGAAAQE